MFCYQCEQTAQGNGCQQIGVCGKDETTATLQDLLVEALKGVSMYAHRARQGGASDPAIDGFVSEALFATLTNVNFDPERVAALIAQAASVRDRARRLYEDTCKAKGTAPAVLEGPAAWQPAHTIDGLSSRASRYLFRCKFSPRGRRWESEAVDSLRRQGSGCLY